ncbi:MAG: replication initiation factor domain-containing protein, partial [Pseudomonadota bacterium]
MKSAQPVLSGSKIKWTLEAVEQANPNLVRVDWLRFTMPVDSVVPREEGGAYDCSWLEAQKLDPDQWALQAKTLHPSAFPQHLAIKIVGADTSLCYLTPRTVALQGALLLTEAVPGVFSVGVVEDSGMDFYTARAAVMREGAVVGWVLAGGKSVSQSGTVHFNLFGSACLHLGPVQLAQVHAFVDRSAAWITRVDLALDVWQGLDIESVRLAYLGGQFDVRGKRPNQQEHGSWTNGHSRTFQVGSRDSGKVMRAYEKGDELFGHEALDPWVRLEGELRNNQRVIDLEVLLKPADYFAGLYPFCRDYLAGLQVENEVRVIPTHNQVADKTALAA